MMTRKRLTVVCLGFAAWCWCMTNAYAQEREPSASPQDGGHPALVAPGHLPWDTFVWVERRYKIEALRFKALDETGYDWAGSDEVVVGTFDAEGYTYTNEIGNIDSGDTHHFDPAKSCIIAVRPGKVILGKTSVCDDVGEAAPLSFRVQFWEMDGEPPLPPHWCHGLPAGQHHESSVCIGFTDDLIGETQLDFSIQELETALPHVGDQYTETVLIDSCGNNVCEDTSFGEYSFTYRITRLPDVRVGLRGLLDEAMRKVGARSELEAIAAGLRALRAPSPRKIEPNEASAPPSTR